MKKKLYTTLLVLLIIFICFVFYFIFYPNLKSDVILYIPTDSNYDKLKEMLSPNIKNKTTFDIIADLKKYNKNVKAGKYSLKKYWGNNKIINYLRTNNEEIDVTFNNQENLNDLAKRISEQIEADSSDIINQILNENFLKKNDLTKETVISIFIPNTYRFYWNTNADKFLYRMIEENKKFWTEQRKEKAKNINLDIIQVITLASIIQKETSMNDEKQKIAGLYINRLKNNMKLQSDPTVIYAIKIKKGFDTDIKRVLLKDLETDSPYNTYKINGIPPSPICIPDVSSIDAVLNYQKHDYIFMCASTDNIGYHNFSKTLKEHSLYRKKYIEWIKKIIKQN